LSRELVEEVIDLARLNATVSALPEERRAELIEVLLEELAEGRGGLPEGLNERLLDGMIDRLIAGKRGEREILGSDGVLGELTRRLVERALSEELTEHLGYPAGHAPPGGTGNPRNGTSPKTILTTTARLALTCRGIAIASSSRSWSARASDAWLVWTRRSSPCTPAG
jgi:hypothetical protein